MKPSRICAGLGMEACESCWLNTANRPGEETQRFMAPMANPPRCKDWVAIPHAATDASHSRL